MIRFSVFVVPLICMVFGCASSANDKDPKPKVIEVETKKIEVKSVAHPQWLDIKYVMGQFDPAVHPDFVKIDLKYADRSDRYMHKTAYEDFQKLYEAALADGIEFKIKSAARNFDYQKGIWERKWTGATLLEGSENAASVYPNPTERAIAILRYSSMPGSSRHHWGTDIDLNAFTNEYFENGQGLKEFEWLEQNAATFGYCRPYTKLGSDRASGYQEEKWHWSYRPISDLCTSFAEAELKNEMITGFKGAEVAQKINIKENYIMGISATCKK